MPGAAFASFPAATAGLPRSPPWWRLPPWGPTQGACPPRGSLARPPRLGQGPSPWAPPGCLAGMSVPQGPMGACRLAGGGPMCPFHGEGLHRPGPHGECGPQGRHTVPLNRPLVEVMGAPSASLTAAWAGVGVAADRLAVGGRGPRRRGGPVRRGGEWPRPGVKPRRAPFPVWFPRLVGQGQGVRVPVCGHEVCARVWSRGRPLPRRGGPSGPLGCSRAGQ